MSLAALPGPPPPVDLVVDASVVVKWFVPESSSDEARRFLDPGFRAHVPALLFIEVGQAVWKRVHQRKEMAPDDGREILRDLAVMPLHVHPTNPLLAPAFDIALATGRSLYDCLDLALATGLGCRMVTADQKLVNALRGGPFAADLLWVTDPL